MTDTNERSLPFHPADFTLDELPRELEKVHDDDTVRALMALDTRVTAPPIYEQRIADIFLERGVVGLARINPAAHAGDVVVVGAPPVQEMTARNRAEIEALTIERGGVAVPLYLIEEV